ncbi:unnamed protein product [Cylicocyclus nassatus]|uniref:Uncharacterized protein n=1 Tax=Cylicocyclus nassatus TaxID=53992 RepID=A0AA36HG38_CYLNA|nr:unnamed protein product [Cylicocyclus nassatus]
MNAAGDEMAQYIRMPFKALERELKNSETSLQILQKTPAYSESSRKIIDTEITRLKEKIVKLRAAREERVRLHVH